MYTKDYIQATYEVLKNGQDTTRTLQSLQKYLTKRGLQKMYPAILRGLAEKVALRNKNVIPKVIVAREKDLQRHRSEIGDVLHQLGMSEKPETHIDASLIGGFIIKGAHTRVDQSFKNKLLHAYRSLID